MSDPLARYAKQVRFSPIGEAGQQQLMTSKALVVGCGALGSVIAETLVRAGVGTVRIVDRDFLELSNLQRQVLYDEADVAAGLPKAIAAAEKLRRINSQVAVEPHVADLTHRNIGELADGVDVIVDGADNFECRLLVNDYAVSSSTPWVFGGCVGAEGQVMPILPGETACLSALATEVPPPGTTPTCDTAGVLAPAVHVVASLQSMEALKILSGNRQAVSRQLLVIDLWSNRVRQLSVERLHEAGTCPTCHDRKFPWLEGQQGSQAAILCGRNAVQLRPSAPQQVDLQAMAEQLRGVGELTTNAFLLRLKTTECELTLFADGRVIVGGAEEEATARTLKARYLGS